MSSLQRLVITSNGTTADFKSVCDLSMGGLDAAQSFLNYIGSLQGGDNMAKLEFQVGSVQATGTITFSSFAADDTITVAGIVLTAKASGATGAQFNIGASPTDNGTAAAAAAKINAYSPFSGIVTATSLLNVVTVTCVVPGLVGNGLGLAISAHGSVSGALLTSGSDGTAYSIDLR